MRELYEAAGQNAVEYDFDLRCLVDYVWFLFRQKDYRRGIEKAENLLILLKGKEKVLPVNWARTCRALTQMYVCTGRKDDAIQFGADVLPLLRELTEKNNNQFQFRQNLAWMCCYLAELYAKNNQTEEAEKLFKESLDQWKQIVGENPSFNRDIAWTSYKLAQFYMSQKRYAEAESYSEESVAINRAMDKENPGKFNNELSMSLFQLADLYRYTDRKEQAKVCREEAIALHRNN